MKTDCNSVNDTGQFIVSSKPIMIPLNSENNIALNMERIVNPDGVWLLELTDYSNESEIE